MQIVHHISGDVHRTLEAKGGVGAKDVVVDGFGKGDHVHAVIGDELGALLGAVAAHNDETIQVQAVVGAHHVRKQAVAVFVHDVLAGNIALAGGAKDGAALGEDAGEVLGFHVLVIALNEPAIAVVHAIDLHIGDALEQSLAHAADGRVETLTIPAAGDQTDACHSFHNRDLLPIKV